MPPQLPPAGQVIRWVESILDGALDQAELEMQEEAGQLSMDTAKLVRDAAMLGMAVGHVGLAVRPSVICTVKATEHSHRPCTHPTCAAPGCKGNVLLPQPAVSRQELGHAYKLVVPHHKTTHQGIDMPVMEIESAKLNRLLHIWQSAGRQLLLPQAERDPQTLFVSNTGRAYSKLDKW
jgi:hypothetical protein